MSKISTVIEALSKNEKALNILNKHCEFDLVEMINEEYNSLSLEKRRMLEDKLVEFELLEKKEVQKERDQAKIKDNKPIYYYNYDYKIKYLEEYTCYKEETKRIIRVFFRKIAEIEKELNKDIYDFNGSEIERALIHLKSTTVRSLQNTTSLLGKYIDYAVNAGLSVQKENLMYNFSSQEKLSKLIDKESSQSLYFTKEEIMNMAMYAENAQDGVILALLYEGVSPKNNFKELVNIKVEDIDFDKGELNIEGRDMPIKLSKETLFLLKGAICISSYYSVNGDKIREYNITKTDYVLRGLRYKGNKPISWRNVNQRILRISVVNKEEYLNATNISASGQINYAYDLYMEDKELGDKAITMALEHFNLPVNKSALFALKKKIKIYKGVHIAS